MWFIEWFRAKDADPEDVRWGTDEELWAQIERGRRETHRISHEDLMRELGID